MFSQSSKDEIQLRKNIFIKKTHGAFASSLILQNSTPPEDVKYFDIDIPLRITSIFKTQKPFVNVHH